MAISIQQGFTSNPTVLRQGIIDILGEKVPEVLDLLTWNDQLTHASGSKMGASFTLEVSGEGPTVLKVTGSIGFPASLKHSEGEVKYKIQDAINELMKRIP